MIGNLDRVDLGYSLGEAVKQHRRDEAQVYVMTVQSLLFNPGMILKEMMTTHKWMVVVDEYHHYADGKAWGEKVRELPHTALLAMSATPSPSGGQKTAFGEPTVSVPYRRALREGAVKRLIGYDYQYHVDTITVEGEVRTFDMVTLTAEAGGEEPDKIEAYKTARGMRWASKYIQPMLTDTLDRLLQQRMATGLPLQAIIGALTVSHAKIVCEQVKSMYGEDFLKVDWHRPGWPFGSCQRRSAEPVLPAERHTRRRRMAGHRRPRQPLQNVDLRPDVLLG